MKYSVSLPVFALLLPFSSAWSADLPRLTQLLEERFVSGYEAGRCGTNIMSLVDAAVSLGIDTQGARILTIEDVNASWFGMVNAEMARGQGRRGETYGEKNWYHHVVLEAEGHILDFDFTNSPTVLATSDYFERMFLDESANRPGDILVVGRDNKLSGYRVSWATPEDYLRAQRDASFIPVVTEVTLCDYLSVTCPASR